MENVSFWRIGEESRLKRVWHLVARALGAQTLLHSGKATRAIIQAPPFKYEYMVSIEDNMPRRFRDLDMHEAQRLQSYQGRPTLVAISVAPSFLEDGVRITLRNPYAVVRGYPGLACISAVSPGGTVAAVLQAALTPLRISDLRITKVWNGVGRMRPVIPVY